MATFLFVLGILLGSIIACGLLGVRVANALVEQFAWAQGLLVTTGFTVIIAVIASAIWVGGSASNWHMVLGLWAIGFGYGLLFGERKPT